MKWERSIFSFKRNICRTHWLFRKRTHQNSSNTFAETTLFKTNLLSFFEENPILFLLGFLVSLPLLVQVSFHVYSFSFGHLSSTNIRIWQFVFRNQLKISIQQTKHKQWMPRTQFFKLVFRIGIQFFSLK